VYRQWLTCNCNWTKPLRGKNQADVQLILPEIHLSLTPHLLLPQVSPVAEPWNRCSQRIPSDKGAFHGIPSATHARGHADPQFGSEHSGVVRPAGLILRTLLQAVTRAIGTGADSRLSGLLDQRKEVSHSSSILIAHLRAFQFLFFAHSDFIEAPNSADEVRRS